MSCVQHKAETSKTFLNGSYLLLVTQKMQNILVPGYPGACEKEGFLLPTVVLKLLNSTKFSG